MEQNLKNLLEAEQEVNRKVQDALNVKNMKLRSIKDSAKADIDEFRAQKQKEYDAKIAIIKKKIEDGEDVDVKDFDDRVKLSEEEKKKKEEAAKKKKENQQQNHLASVTMEVIERDYAQNKERVIDLLVSNVLAVNIEIPKVVKGTF